MEGPGSESPRARQFLPSDLCTRCEVVEESATHIVREATIAGDDLSEIIAFEPEKKVTFFQATGPREGAVNELSEDDAGALQLRFYCYTRLRGKKPFGPRSRSSRRSSTTTRATRQPCCPR
jgi:hypothetical protein